MNAIRSWLLKRLFTEDEKLLLVMAIEDRMHRIETTSATERWADPTNSRTDVDDYSRLRKVFSTTDWV